MKQMLPLFSAIVLLAACNSQPKTNVEAAAPVPAVVIADTAGLAQFQAWKAQHELADVKEYKSNAVAAAPVKKRYQKTSAPVRRPAANPTVDTQSGTMNSESANTAQAPQKKGWSKAAKGTAIGAGSGAVVGAVINKKNRVVGGVIGGVAGGAVGYGIGRKLDKRDGRY